ncbi:MAG: hypothetical protein JST65_07715 [Acidobacteria bacterium]|nr:hypothetical protein [Acidobacteriota bacterium]
MRSLLGRVARLEQARSSPWTRFFGTPEEFAADMQRGMDAGIYDKRDMPAVVASIRRWCREGMWR